MPIRLPLILLFISPFGFGELSSQSSEEQLAFAFKSHGSQTSLEPQRMIVVGDVIGVEKASFFEVDKISAELDVDTRPDTVTIKVLNPKSIRIGQILYLLEKNLDHKNYRDGNIVGMITVKSIFLTTFFGWQVRGEGFLRLIEDRQVTAARLIDTTKYQESFLAKKQGDYFVAKGKIEEAIRMYKHSIALDSGFPDTHFALGKVHWNDGEGYVSAGYEFSKAWKGRERFSNQQEKLSFYLEYMRFLIFQYKTEHKENAKSLDLLPEIAREARILNPKNYEAWLYSFESAYLKYMQSNAIGVDSRKMKEEWSERVEESLKKAMELRKSDYYLHHKACEFFNSKWKEARGTGTPKEIEYRNKLVEHGKLLRIYYTGETTLPEEILNAIRSAEKQSGLL